MRPHLTLLASAIAVTASGLNAQQAAPPNQPPASAAQSTNLGSDANGNPLRRATKTGHVSNYDETKVPRYTLPDPLKFADGTVVRDAKTWQTHRRPEIIKLYETQIFGRLPSNLPKVRWQITGSDPKARDGQAIKKQVVGTVGEGPRAVQINLSVYTPAGASKPVPVIIL